MLQISQSLIKEVLKHDHCPKQVYFSFVEGKDLIEPSEAMLTGRYFESELLGACRGGKKQEAKMINKGKEKAQAYKDCDELVLFAKGVLDNLGIRISENFIQVELISDFLKGNIDLISNDIISKDDIAIYDIKWTGTKEDDRWNGWGDPANNQDAEIQAVHYTMLYHKKYGVYPPFYFLIFGKDRWVKILRFRFSEDAIELHKERIKYTADKISQYADEKWKGNGSFNKCISCPFYNMCDDRATVPQIEEVII
ncbi:PD-(D/E)XK nuclease family protein [Niabella sp. CC-SYL272]|uniref:PD-(D/E)XK nuclease family protein n=1 Tax=Niabella agricola TaxID=2891571 RepID=UPI001F3167D2|nr:PD-(D/E)XK nuclease family protein [Niabella agricola]MCF3107280.1 PD-(D/E)XK nuclease family protein [Niabella agricola]